MQIEQHYWRLLSKRILVKVCELLDKKTGGFSNKTHRSLLITVVITGQRCELFATLF